MSELRSSVDELAGEDLATVTGSGLAADLVELRRQIDRLEAQWLRRLSAFDIRGAWQADGSLSAAGWLRSHCRMTYGSARERVSVARQLDLLPATASAFGEGDLGYPQVRVISFPCAAATPQVRAALEPVLVDAGCRLDPAGLKAVVAHWRHALDPEAALREANDQHAARRLHVSSSLGGMVVLDGLLDPEGGATLLTALSALRSAGRAGDDDRSPAQWRADALWNSPGAASRRACWLSWPANART